MDRPVHAAATEHPLVGRVDDGVDARVREIAFGDGDPWHRPVHILDGIPRLYWFDGRAHVPRG
jgi:hypothetical protein